AQANQAGGAAAPSVYAGTACAPARHAIAGGGGEYPAHAAAAQSRYSLPGAGRSEDAGTAGARAEHTGAVAVVEPRHPAERAVCVALDTVFGIAGEVTPYPVGAGAAYARTGGAIAAHAPGVRAVVRDPIYPVAVEAGRLPVYASRGGPAR